MVPGDIDAVAKERASPMLGMSSNNIRSHCTRWMEKFDRSRQFDF